MNKRVISLIMGGMLVVSNLGLSFANEETIKQFVCRHCGEPYNVSDYHQCDVAMVTCKDCGKEYNAYDYHQCDVSEEETKLDKENVKEVVNNPTHSNDKTYKSTNAKSTSYSSDKVDNPKTSDMGVISAIGGLVTAIGGLIFTRKH